MNARRLVLYLLLNAVVSAAVAFGVLWLWNQTHPLLYLPPAASVAQATETELPLALSPTPPAPSATPAVQPTQMTYIVQAGDTLGSIAERYGITLDQLMAANGLTNPNVVSAGQTLVIPAAGAAPPTAGPSTPSLLPTNPPETPLPTSTIDPNQPAPDVSIRDVTGAGSLADEVVVLANDGGTVDLVGWTLRDEAGHLYTFPTFQLLNGGTVSLHTTSGTNTAIDLYWGLAGAVWSSGKNVLLSDQGGNLRARYTVP